METAEFPALSRRAALATLAVGAAALLAPASPLGGEADAQTTLNPDQALKRMMDGNARFVSGRLTSFQQDLKLLKQKTAEKQEPFAAVLSCSDSRVPVEIVFDQTIGHVFVARVAGNVATAELIASLEYGVAVLGTRAIMVLGHGGCGAVSATIAGKEVPGQISTLYRLIRPAVEQAGTDLTAAIKANARIQAGLLRDTSPVLGGAIRDGRLKVVAAFYDLSTGAVSLLD